MSGERDEAREKLDESPTTEASRERQSEWLDSAIVAFGWVWMLFLAIIALVGLGALLWGLVDLLRWIW